MTHPVKAVEIEPECSTKTTGYRETDQINDTIKSLDNNLTKLSDALKLRFKRLVCSQLSLLKYRENEDWGEKLSPWNAKEIKKLKDWSPFASDKDRTGNKLNNSQAAVQPKYRNILTERNKTAPVINKYFGETDEKGIPSQADREFWRRNLLDRNTTKPHSNKTPDNESVKTEERQTKQTVVIRTTQDTPKDNLAEKRVGSTSANIKPGDKNDAAYSGFKDDTESDTTGGKTDECQNRNEYVNDTGYRSSRNKTKSGESEKNNETNLKEGYAKPPLNDNIQPHILNQNIKGEPEEFENMFDEGTSSEYKHGDNSAVHATREIEKTPGDNNESKRPDISLMNGRDRRQVDYSSVYSHHYPHIQTREEQVADNINLKADGCSRKNVSFIGDNEKREEHGMSLKPSNYRKENFMPDKIATESTKNYSGQSKTRSTPAKYGLNDMVKDTDYNEDYLAERPRVNDRDDLYRNREPISSVVQSYNGDATTDDFNDKINRQFDAYSNAFGSDQLADTSLNGNRYLLQNGRNMPRENNSKIKQELPITITYFNDEYYNNSTLKQIPRILEDTDSSGGPIRKDDNTHGKASIYDNAVDNSHDEIGNRHYNRNFMPKSVKMVPSEEELQSRRGENTNDKHKSDDFYDSRENLRTHPPKYTEISYDHRDIPERSYERSHAHSDNRPESTHLPSESHTQNERQPVPKIGKLEHNRVSYPKQQEYDEAENFDELYCSDQYPSNYMMFHDANLETGPRNKVDANKMQDTSTEKGHVHGRTLVPKIQEEQQHMNTRNDNQQCYQTKYTMEPSQERLSRTQGNVFHHPDTIVRKRNPTFMTIGSNEGQNNMPGTPNDLNNLNEPLRVFADEESPINEAGYIPRHTESQMPNSDTYSSLGRRVDHTPDRSYNTPDKNRRHKPPTHPGSRNTQRNHYAVASGNDKRVKPSPDEHNDDFQAQLYEDNFNLRSSDSEGNLQSVPLQTNAKEQYRASNNEIFKALFDDTFEEKPSDSDAEIHSNQPQYIDGEKLSIDNPKEQMNEFQRVANETLHQHKGDPQRVSPSGSQCYDVAPDKSQTWPAVGIEQSTQRDKRKLTHFDGFRQASNSLNHPSLTDIIRTKIADDKKIPVTDGFTDSHSQKGHSFEQELLDKLKSSQGIARDGTTGNILPYDEIGERLHSPVVSALSNMTRKEVDKTLHKVFDRNELNEISNRIQRIQRDLKGVVEWFTPSREDKYKHDILKTEAELYRTINHAWSLDDPREAAATLQGLKIIVQDLKEAAMRLGALTSQQKLTNVLMPILKDLHSVFYDLQSRATVEGNKQLEFLNTDLSIDDKAHETRKRHEWETAVMENGYQSEWTNNITVYHARTAHGTSPVVFQPIKINKNKVSMYLAGVIFGVLLAFMCWDIFGTISLYYGLINYIHCKIKLEHYGPPVY